MHRRRIVREAAVSRLVGLATTGSRVFGSRSQSLGASQLPALRVYVTEEAMDSSGETFEAEGSFHRMQLRVEALAKASDDVDDLVDGISEEVEAKVIEDPTLGAVTEWCAYQSTEVDFQDEDQTVVQATMVFEVAYIEE